MRESCLDSQGHDPITLPPSRHSFGVQGRSPGRGVQGAAAGPLPPPAQGNAASDATCLPLPAQGSSARHAPPAHRITHRVSGLLAAARAGRSLLESFQRGQRIHTNLLQRRI